MQARGLLLYCVAAFGLGCQSAELVVSPGEVVTVESGDSINGSIDCEEGMLSVLPGATVNGDIEARDCVLKIGTANNGDIIAVGGSLVSIQDTTTINGDLDLEGVAKVVVVDSGFNGGLDIRGSLEVTVANSSFNGHGDIRQAVDVVATGNDFNGDFEISDVGACIASDNTTNGDLAVADCQP